ncbi:protease inhibitor I42 family protein [Clostridium tyrobutyricum]|uniref:protease inhibitor I42 family protein n=1 Tax=Clostridium tyrobutyricum TaxID=1519 RepID=UPI0011CCB9D2|nr:protease inhibitor I42 family protein [Clostridium tyrobutyricum]
MKKRKNIIFMSLLLTIFILFINNSTTLAFDSTNRLVARQDISPNKVWSIKFSEPVNKASLDNSSIYIKDNNGNLLDLNFTLNSDKNIVEIHPASNIYSPDNTYILYVNNNVKALSGKHLNNNLELPFLIKSDAIKINENNNNQTINIKKGDKLEISLIGHVDGGYLWSFKQNLDTNMLKLVYDTNIRTSPQDNIGASITRRWLIEAVNSGSTSIDLEELNYQHKETEYSSYFHLNVNIN